MHKPRIAFTLTEVLVVAAISSTLMALLLPAIQSARESARARECQSRLRQIGIAALNFHDAHLRLPPGYLGPGQPVDINYNFKDQYVGHLAYMLPQLEMTNVYDRIEVDLDVRNQDVPWWVDASTYGIAQAKLPVFICPSASPDPVGVIFLVHYYFRFDTQDVYAGAQASTGEPTDLLLGLTNYHGCAGAWGITGTNWDDYQGVFTDRSKTRMKDIVDGTSQTLLFGESLGHREKKDIPHAWMGSGPLHVGTGIGGDHGTNYSSSHPGIVQFCYADGSVRSIDNEVDTDVVIALGGMFDGELVIDPSVR